MSGQSEIKNTGIRFTDDVWTVAELVAKIEGKDVNLQPHYQRNAIWSVPAQRKLIQTIKEGYPVPNLFVRRLPNSKYEMVDGQQRCRAILAYKHGILADEDEFVFVVVNGGAKGKAADLDWKQRFDRYPIQISILDSSVSNTEVEKFYVLVNQSGMRLTAAELRKADAYDTRLLALVTELCGSPELAKLKLFTDRSAARMNDTEYVAELIGYLAHGFVDKKDKIDDMFEEDVTQAEASDFRSRFGRVISDIVRLNDIRPLNRTRYRQKNDFYTLFAFFDQDRSRNPALDEYIYRTLLLLAEHISPSQEACEPLQNYALNCVSQSNSKKAREARDMFFKDLFSNSTAQFNPTQEAILKYFETEGARPVPLNGRTLLPNEYLVKAG